MARPVLPAMAAGGGAKLGRVEGNLLLDRYAHKVRTAAEIRDLVGSRPRDRRVIMCHGVFDIVHPGHVRHLIYAKSKASVLIASLTADRHITKGESRPHVPQDLRAFNLAAFEAVDFVLIDDKAEPVDNIALIQPDYFAKGFEYAAAGSAKTDKELTALQAYGGEILFTPGDVVYSSSKLITLSAPVLRLTKLQATFERWDVTCDKLRQTVDRMRGRLVHVVGDTIVDGYVHCGLGQGQPKTPTIGAMFQRECEFVGGAAIVAKHLAAAGGDVTFTTVLGDDRCRSVVMADLLNAGVKCLPVIDKARPTTQKKAYVVDGHRILKVDTLDNSSITDAQLATMTHWLRDTHTDGIVFSDFRHGIFNQRTIPAFVDAIPRRSFRAADSQVASRWGNVLQFADFDLITPNEREARHALSDQDSGIRPLASRLYDAARCGVLVLKLGDRGVLGCMGADHSALDSFVVVDPLCDAVVDPVGAGDALLAYATLAMMADGGAVQATILGSMAAAVKVGRDGNVAVSADDVRAMIDATEEAMR